MRYAEGDVQRADYFLDCSVYEYFFRVKSKKEYYEWLRESHKK